MKTPTTMQAIRHFEKQLKKLDPTSVLNASITVYDQDEIRNAFEEIKKKHKDIKLYEPYQYTEDQSYFFFKYPIPGRPFITLKVKTDAQNSKPKLPIGFASFLSKNLDAVKIQFRPRSPFLRLNKK